MKNNSKQHCEQLRQQAKNLFSQYRSAWCEYLRWADPARGKWLLSQTPGQRNNQHIVDRTHTLALRSFRAGFLEGNTSASRPWVRIQTRDNDLNQSDNAKTWLQHFTGRVLSFIGNSNFYNAAGTFYNDYGIVNTGAHYFEELANGGVFVHTLEPGSYYVLNNSRGEADVLIREFTLNVMSLVDSYVKQPDGSMDWDKTTLSVRNMYENSSYSELVDIVQCIRENPNYDIENPDLPGKRKWLEQTYELGGGNGYYFSSSQQFGTTITEELNKLFLVETTRRRKPFVIGKSTITGEYGETGPTSDSLGLIKSLQKKAIAKDQAIEQILKPALQGPASLRRSYISHAPNTFVPLDARSVGANAKLEPIFQVNPGLGALIQDVSDLRQQVDKLYFADFLLYLSKNPKTRTATETAAILEEQQRIVGPNLQSLNTTYNIPVVEYFMDYVLYEDPFLDPVPEELAGQALQPEFVSVFAQAQKAADLPAVNQYVQAMMNVSQVKPEILQKFNTDKFADLLEDRLYLPSGLNRDQAEVDQMRQQAQQQAQRQEAMQNTIPAMAKAAKDVSAAQPRQAEE